MEKSAELLLLATCLCSLARPLPPPSVQPKTCYNTPKMTTPTPQSQGNPRTIRDYSTPEIPSWCPGCGDFGILTALKKALLDQNIAPHDALVVSGIGCGSLLPYWVATYGACTLHGRAIPFASGAHLANTNLRVVVNIGDGDGLGIGMGHFVHFFRRNMDVTVMCDNNGVYGLTKGQTAPTANKGMKTSSTPFGAVEDPVNGPALALMMGATYVARGYSADAPGLTALLAGAIAHRGAAYVDILQPCVTFNKIETYDFYGQHTEKSEQMLTPRFTNRQEAMHFAMQKREKIFTGLLFQQEAPTYADQHPQLADKTPLAQRPVSGIDTSAFLAARA